jgi:hypothetical protein
MWKIQPGEHLVTGSKFFGIIPDGRIYTIDLLNGTKSEGQSGDGDLHVLITRPAGVERSSRYDWSYRIEGINGGVKETQDEFMYTAPESGYQTAYEKSFAAKQGDWTDRLKKNFYIRSRGGTIYGRLEVEIVPVYQDKSVFSIVYAVNPKGSRNLENGSR